MGQEILDFGLNEAGIPAKRVSSDRGNDGCHRPNNKSLNATNLFNRCSHQAESSSESMKIRKIVEIHSLKKSFKLQIVANLGHFLSYRFAQHQVAHAQTSRRMGVKYSANTLCLF